jgi:uncharacterized protein YndB with AHSA1/START domain/ketosteroid isomerase-like protein
MSTVHSDRGLAIEIEQEFAAASDRVFSHWIRPESLARWFAPGDYTTVAAEVDARPGGEWRLVFRSGDGRHEYTEQGAFRAIDHPRRLEFTLTQVDAGRANPETLVTVEFDDLGTADAPRTRMRFRQTGYTAPGLRDENADGWRECFAKLEWEMGGGGATGTMTSAEGARADEADLRDLFEAWFDASERKDLDASMDPVAPDVVSYEHEAPQEYRGVEAVREVCAAGFDYQTGDFRWDIPDLQIRVAGDLAVTWGLNRMRDVQPDGSTRERWSRGTRVFERRDGRWRMVHQHVSFPVDAEGQAVTVR